MTREQSFSLAATAMSVAAAITTFYLTPIIENSPTNSELTFLSLLLGIPGFYIVFKITHRLICQFQYHRILGTWHYVTSPYDASTFKDSNFGKMKFSLDPANDLVYSVELFSNLDALIDSNLEPLKGFARSDAIRYHSSSNELKILYHVDYNAEGSSNPARYGRLFLSLTTDGTLTGHWVSDLHKSEISSGVMYAARPADFPKRLDQLDVSVHRKQSVAAEGVTL